MNDSIVAFIALILSIEHTVHAQQTIRTIEMYVRLEYSYTTWLMKRKHYTRKDEHNREPCASWLNLRSIFCILIIWIRMQSMLYVHGIHTCATSSICNLSANQYSYWSCHQPHFQWTDVMSIKFSFGNEKWIYLNPKNLRNRCINLHFCYSRWCGPKMLLSWVCENENMKKVRGMWASP